jgi:hypothetical protein
MGNRAVLLKKVSVQCHSHTAMFYRRGGIEQSKQSSFLFFFKSEEPPVALKMGEEDSADHDDPQLGHSSHQ